MDYNLACLVLLIVSFVGDLVQEYFRREMNACYRTNTSYARIVAMNSCSQFRNRNFMLRRALRMSRDAARNAEELARCSAAAIPVATESNARCSQLYAPPVVRRPLFRSSRPVKDQSTAGTASRPDVASHRINDFQGV